MNDFPRLWAECREASLAAIDSVGESGWYVLGEEVSAFEAALAKYCGAGYAVGCGNGMDAIEIALRIAGVGPGDKVLTTPLSAFATGLAILRAGAEPVFCDVDQHGLIDPEMAEHAYSIYPDIRAIIPVHLYGHLADMRGLEAVAGRHNAILIEDAAQAIGARRSGEAVGTRGDMVCFSFYPTKNLGAIGDGGALVLSENSDAETARSLRNYGQTDRYIHEAIGLNSRLDEVHAAILHRVFLARLDGWLDRRRAIAMRYLSEIREDSLTLMPGPDPRGSGWHLFPVLVDPARRRALVEHLRASGVGSGMHYPVLIPDQGAMTGRGASLASDPLSTARKFSEGEVSLPIHPYLTDSEVSHVISTVNSWGG